jgi:CRISPR/Cas system-associated exonuclease Cas4 (RecB family)
MAIQVKSLSFSTVNQYVTCPERVWLEKVEHTPKKGGMTVNAVFGVAMHSTVAAFYRGLLNKVVFNLETLFRVFKIRFNSIPVPEDPDLPKSELMDQAKDLLEQFVRLDPPKTIITIEQPYRFKMTPKLEVVCQPDLVIRDKDGTLTIIDWKTTGKKYAADQIRKVTEQTLVYGMAFHEPIKSRALLFLRKKNSEIMDIPLNPDSIEPSELIQKFSGVQKALENEIHYRNRTWMCNGCPYSYICNATALEADLEEEERLAA